MMTRKATLAALLIFAFISPAGYTKGSAEVERPCAEIKAFSPAMTCTANIDALKPLQRGLGMLNVMKKENKVRSLKKKSDAKLANHLLKKKVVAVVGPEKRLYLVEHHHLVRALWNLGIKAVPVTIAADLSKLSEKDFDQAIREKGWICPHKGQPPKLADLPQTIQSLPDDPHRSLADRVHDKGGFESDDTPFSECRWADFFRSRIKLKDGSETSISAALSRALLLARSPEARGLPGYKPTEKKRDSENEDR